MTRSSRRSVLLLLLPPLLLLLAVAVVIDVGEGQEVDSTVVDQQQQERVIFDGVVSGGIATKIKVGIEPKQYFTFIEVNTSNVEAVWRLPSGNELKLRKGNSGKLMLLYDGNDGVGCRRTDPNEYRIPNHADDAENDRVGVAGHVAPFCTFGQNAVSSASRRR